MEHSSLLECIPNLLSQGQETAFLRRSGYRTGRWSYSQLVGTAFRFARELELRGISKGERVLLWGPNSAQWVAAFWGCALRGVVIVPIDDIATQEFAVRVYGQVSAKLLVCSRQRVSPSIPCIAVEDLPTVLARHSSSLYVPAAISGDDTLEIVFTSGTTADPKGVVITHGNVLSNITPLETEITKYLKYERLVHPIRFLNLLPLSHVFGQFLGIFLPPLFGGIVVFQDSLKPSEVIATLRRERISVLVTVPRVLQALKEKVERDLDDRGLLTKFRRQLEDAKAKHFLLRWWIFRYIRRQFGWKFWACICGGAALDRVTEEFWDRLGYAVIQGYGLTETTSLISVNHPFRLGKGSIGKVLEGREVRLASNGEILVRGGGVAAGYWNGNENRPLADTEGWYRTGDIGELDANGNLYFKGRKKEVIVTPAGMNVYPEDLEAALRLQSGVKDAVVVPLARDGNAEPCAVMLLNGARINPEVILREANESLADYQRMVSFFVWPENDFPRTSTWKPRRNVIAQVVEKDLQQKVSPARAPTAVAELIAHITGRIPRELSSNAQLESDLNLSSLDRVELLSALEDRYQIDLTDTSFSAARTIADLERMLQGEVPPRVHYHYPHWVLLWPITSIRLLVHYLLLRPAIFLLGWPHIEGRGNLRGQDGPLLVICNHIGDIDPGFVLTALPARFRHRLAIATGGEALEILRTPPVSRNLLGRGYDWVKWALGVSLLNLFPLPREAGFRDSFDYVGECLDRGYSVLLFPEGHHTNDGKLRPFFPGIGLLASRLGVPVVPMRIDGLFEAKQAGRKFAWPGQIRVKIGFPVQFEHDSDPEWIAKDLQARVAQL